MAYNYPRTLVLLATLPASSSSTISFTSDITSSFSIYYVSLRNIPATNNVSLNLLFSTDNGGTYLASNYLYTHNEIISASTLTSTGNTSTTASILTIALNNSASSGFSGDMYLYNMNQTIPAYYKGMGCCLDTSSHYHITRFSGGNSGTTAVNAIQFLMSSGAITSGTFILYGVVET